MPNYVKTSLNDLTSKVKNITELEFLLETLPPLSENGPWVAGGSLLRTYISLPLTTDLDIFFRDQQQYDTYFQKFKEFGADSRKYTIESERSQTNWHKTCVIKYRDKQYTIQFINKKFFTSMCNVLDSFDLDICQMGFDGKNLFHVENCFDRINSKNMSVNVVNIPQVTLKRLIKYTKLGFEISDSDIQMFFAQCAKIPNFVSLFNPSKTEEEKSTYDGL